MPTGINTAQNRRAIGWAAAAIAMISQKRNNPKTRKLKNKNSLPMNNHKILTLPQKINQMWPMKIKK